MNSVRSALRGAGEPEVVPRCTVMPSVRSPDRGLLLSYGGEAHGKQETDRDAVRLSGGGAVQHRRAVHQADPLGGHGHQRGPYRHRPGGDRGISGGDPPPAPVQPLGRGGGAEHLRHQRPVLRGQQADHGGQRDRSPVHRPHFCHSVFRPVLEKKARPAGSAGLRDRVRRGALLLRGQPGDGRWPGQCAGPPAWPMQVFS